MPFNKQLMFFSLAINLQKYLISCHVRFCIPHAFLQLFHLKSSTKNCFMDRHFSSNFSLLQNGGSFFNLFLCNGRIGAGIVQSVQRLANGWTVRGSNPGGGRDFSAPVQIGPGAHPASCTMGTGSFLGVKRPGRGVDHPPHLAPRLKEEQSYISAPPLSVRGLFQGELCNGRIRTVHSMLTSVLFSFLISRTHLSMMSTCSTTDPSFLNGQATQRWKLCRNTVILMEFRVYIKEWCRFES